jgi:signal transduction histidine kinase
MLNKIKAYFNQLPLNKRASLIISIWIFVFTILLTLLLQIILKESEMSILNSLKDQFPNYVAARENILDAFMGDRLSRYFSYLPLFALVDMLINYYLISYLINRFYGPLGLIFDHIKRNGVNSKMEIAIKNNNISEYISLIENYNNIVKDVNNSEGNLEEFVQNATHEIKTPLFGIKTSIDVLNLKSKPSISEYKNFELTVELLTNRLIKMVDSLIILTKDKVEFLSNDKINLSDTLEKTIRLLKSKADAFELVIKTDIEENLYYKAQKRFIDSIFMNILDNAIKYSKPKSEISISLKKVSGKIIFRCIDKGLGIPQSEIIHIKEKFYRASNIIDEGVEGSGLGLSVVDKIINEYGGKFEIESKVGFGTQITIEL